MKVPFGKAKRRPLQKKRAAFGMKLRLCREREIFLIGDKLGVQLSLLPELVVLPFIAVEDIIGRFDRRGIKIARSGIFYGDIRIIVERLAV